MRRVGCAATYVVILLGVLAAPASAWDVKCEQQPGVACTDPYDTVRRFWDAHPRAEHRALLARTLELSRLPADFQLPFDVTVFSADTPLTAVVRKFEVTGPVFLRYSHESIAPVRRGAARRRVRPLSISGMASLPDFSYTLWDWASGNEHCPPDPANPDAVDCHNYETHIGWLNSNHMVPQSRKFYEHLHRLALDKARRCKQLYDAIPALEIQRYGHYVRACEKLALTLEAVGQHYLQDSWASGHMWGRWGGPEIADFGGDRALGFVVAALTGLIHGGKAALDEKAPTNLFAPWDDPLNAPYATVEYVDPAPEAAPFLPGLGDVFLPLLDVAHPDPEDMRSVPLPASFEPQRRALFGCAVDGVREVYGATAQFHGEMGTVSSGEVDTDRRVGNGSCWDQRVTNAAIAAGCGLHQGRFPTQLPIELDATTDVGIILVLAETSVAPAIAGAPVLEDPLLTIFRMGAAAACTLAHALGRTPELANGTDLASGAAMPSLAGIRPNAAYARGDADTPPASWADPFLPWRLEESDPDLTTRTQALNLTFADAHVAERCAEYTEDDLRELRSLVEDAKDGDPVVLDARLGQCVQQVAPHLRFGVEGDHDSRREALCAFAGPTDAAFVYTGEDPASFTGAEETDLASLLAATEQWCATSPAVITATFAEAVDPGVDSPLRILVERDGPEGPEPFAGVFLELSATGGTVGVDSGATDQTGTFETTARLADEASEITITIIARDAPDGDELARETITATRKAAGPLGVDFTFGSTTPSSSAYIEQFDPAAASCQKTQPPDPNLPPLFFSETCSSDRTGPNGGTASATGMGSVDVLELPAPTGGPGSPLVGALRFLVATECHATSTTGASNERMGAECGASATASFRIEGEPGAPVAVEATFGGSAPPTFTGCTIVVSDDDVAVVSQVPGTVAPVAAIVPASGAVTVDASCGSDARATAELPTVDRAFLVGLRVTVGGS